MVFCTSCGSKLPDPAPNFCPSCGKPQSAGSVSKSSPSSSRYGSSANSSSRSSPSSSRSQAYQKSVTYASPEVKQPGPPSHASERCPGCGAPTNNGAEKLVVSGKEWHRDCYMGNSGDSGSSRGGSYGNDSLKCGLPSATYEHQPSWAYSEQVSLFMILV